MKENKIRMVLWVYKQFFGRELDLQKDNILIQNMVTFFEVIEEVADRGRRLDDMFKS